MTARTFRYQQVSAAAVESLQRFLDNVDTPGYSTTLSTPSFAGGGLFVDYQLDPYTPLRLARLDARMEHIGFERVARAGTPSEQAHESLRSLEHFIAHGPHSGFGNQVFPVREPTGSLLPTKITWYRDSEATEPIYEVRYVRRGGRILRKHYRVFDEDGVAVAGVMYLCRGIGQDPTILASSLETESLWWQGDSIGYTYAWRNPNGRTLFGGQDKIAFVFQMVPGVWPVGTISGFWRQSGGSGTIYFGQDGSNRGRWYVGGSYYLEQRQLEPYMPVILVVQVDLTQATATNRIICYSASPLYDGGASFVSIPAGGSGGTVETVWDSNDNNPIVLLGDALTVAYGHVLAFPGVSLTAEQRSEILDTPVGGYPVMRDPLRWSFLSDGELWLPAGDGLANQSNGTVIDVIGQREFAPEVAV